MLHAALIPHEAIQALCEGGKMMRHLGRVQPLFSPQQASQTLGMSARQIVKLLKERKLFGLMPRKGKA